MDNIWGYLGSGIDKVGKSLGNPLPELGISEWLVGQAHASDGNFSQAPTSSQGTPKIPASGYGEQYASHPAPNTTDASGKAVYNPPPKTSGGGSSPGYSPTHKGQTVSKDGTTYKSVEDNGVLSWIEESQGDQEAAARAAAEARRQAAYRSYQGKVNIANEAKTTAKGQYDWLVDTLGSNKKDLLDEVALNEKTGIEEYERQEVKTKENYDKSRQEILSTYRDLSREQEKILRGAGVASSSRSTEAQLRLNNLMGKDLGTISTGEADSLAMIGNALATFKERVSLTRNSIESEAKSKADKAALDYDAQIRAINANLQLDANAREDAIAAADTQLAVDTAKSLKWAAGLKLQVEMTIAEQKGTLDDFIVDMTDSQGLLDADLGTKQTATENFINSISSAVTFDAEGNLTMPTGEGARTKVKSLASIYDPEKVGLAGTGVSTAASNQQGTVQNVSSNDPLRAAVLA